MSFWQQPVSQSAAMTTLASAVMAIVAVLSLNSVLAWGSYSAPTAAPLGSVMACNGSTGLLNEGDTLQYKCGDLYATSYPDVNPAYFLDPNGISKLGGELWLGKDATDRHFIKNVYAPTSANDVANRSYVDVTVGNYRYVFVTSQTYTGNLGNQSGANAKCQSLASARYVATGDARYSGTWKAWISVSGGTSASTNISCSASNIYYRLDDTKIANNCSDLTDASLLAPISIDENNTSGVSANVWTNTTTSGASSTNDCSAPPSWTSSSSAIQGYYGNSASSTGTWTFLNRLACNNQYRLYCFQTLP